MHEWNEIKMNGGELRAPQAIECADLKKQEAFETICSSVVAKMRFIWVRITKHKQIDETKLLKDVIWIDL